MPEALTNPDARLIPWETFQSTFLDPPLGAEIPVAGEPDLSILVQPGGGRLALRLPIAEWSPPDTRMRAVRFARDGEQLLLAATDPQLFQAFYALMLDISDRVQLDRIPVLEAVEQALRVWRRLLAGLGGLTHEKQVGLTGELWALVRLLDATGPEALGSWTGPLREAHDFRFGTDEIEVKTTSDERRRHLISRLEQLQPSPDRSLWILSIQVARAGPGEGWTLAEQVRAVRDRLAETSALQPRFSQLLELAGWSDEDAAIYPDRWQLRTDPLIVRVDDNCPRITKTLLEEAVGEASRRIDNVSYRVDLEGLGDPDGGVNFPSRFTQS